MPDSPMSPAEYAAAQAKEYGTYVALVPIEIDGARAFNPGHAVPVGHVTSGVVAKSDVAKVESKAADAVVPAANPVQKG